jgi:beta-lactamase regulating signal transducer with metallopeptidase domain
MMGTETFFGDPLWLLAIRLAVGATLLTATALLALRMVAAPVWRRTIAQAAAIGLLLILFGELTGVVEPIADSFARLLAASEQNIEDRESLAASALELKIDDFDIERDTFDAPIDSAMPIPIQLDFARQAEPSNRRVWAVIWLGGLLIGALWFGVRCVCDMRVVAKLKRTARPCVDARIGRRVTELSQTLGVWRRVWIAMSSQLASPVAWGVARPTIGLPERFVDDHDPLTQDAMLAHELAHHAAWDPCWRRVMDFVVALWWWHPLAWILRSRYSANAEVAADEASTCVEDGPARLAAALVRLGGELTAPRTAWVGAAGPFRSQLGQRVTRLLRLKSTLQQNPRFVRAFAARGGLVGVLLLLTIFGTAWARPRPTSMEGDFSMQRFTHSWRASLVGSALVGLLAASPVAAGDGEDGRVVVTVRPEDDRETRPEQEGYDDYKIRKRDSEARHIEAVHAELAVRENAVRELKTRLGQLRDGQNQEATDIKNKLDLIVAEMSKLRAQLKGERIEFVEKRSAEIKRLEDQLAEHKERIARLLKDGRKDEAEKLQRQAHDLVATLNKEMFRDQERITAETAKKLAQQQKELHGQLKKLAGELKELTAAGKHDQAESVKATIASLQAKMQILAVEMNQRGAQREIFADLARHFPAGKPRRFTESTHHPSETAKRAHHLYAAAKNLREAGMHDLAEKLQRDADKLAAVGGDKGRADAEVEFVLKREKGDKSEAVIATLVSELKAMRHEMDELRGQLKKLQGERTERRE